MPLTVTPDESEERRRRLYGDLAASGDKAMGYGFDALSKMEAMAKDKRATERQTALDNDARAKATADLTLRQSQDTREGAREKRDAERDAFDLEQARGKATRDSEDRTLTLTKNKEATEAERHKDARAKMDEIIKSGVAQNMDDDQIAEIIKREYGDEYDVNVPDVVMLTAPERIKAKQAAAERERTAENDTRALDIREQAAKPKGGSKPVDPVKAATAEANRRAAEARATEAERKAKTNAAGEPMSESEVGKLARGDSLITDIESLQPIAAKQPMGVAGFLQRRIPDFAQSLKPDAMVQFDQMHGFVMKQIAKGIEEGAITPGEQEQYNNMLASSSSSPEAYMESLNRILGIMKQRQATKREALKASGYNVPAPAASISAGSDIDAKRARQAELRARAAQP